MGRRPPARTPSFLKILLQEHSKKLLIPPKFVRLHRGTLARKCTLRPTGTQDSWSVRTKQINNSLYFKKGWKKFAQHYSLGFGDLLVFRYVRDCEFYVDMFDKSCCFKEPVTFHNVESQKDTTPILPSQEKKANPKTSALDAAEEFMSSSEFPAFIKVMQGSYVRGGGYMPLPLDFAKMHWKDSLRKLKIEVSGKTWTVRVKDSCGYRLTGCWSSVVKKHALKVGDVCVFELIDTEDYTLRLSIYSSTNCEFYEDMFDESCCSKEPVISQNIGSQKDTTPILPRKNKNCQTKARSGKVLEAHSSKALTAAKKFSSLSKYPSCIRVMHLTYLRDYLHVPSAFVKQMKVTEGAKNVKLRCLGKEWDAVLRTYSIRSTIQNGWTTFVEENSLKIGDVCVLELIDKKNALIKFTIF